MWAEEKEEERGREGSEAAREEDDLSARGELVAGLLFVSFFTAERGALALEAGRDEGREGGVEVEDIVRAPKDFSPVAAVAASVLRLAASAALLASCVPRPVLMALQVAAQPCCRGTPLLLRWVPAGAGWRCCARCNALPPLPLCLLRHV